MLVVIAAGSWLPLASVAAAAVAAAALRLGLRRPERRASPAPTRAMALAAATAAACVEGPRWQRREGSAAGYHAAARKPVGRRPAERGRRAAHAAATGWRGAGGLDQGGGGSGRARNGLRGHGGPADPTRPDDPSRCPAVGSRDGLQLAGGRQDARDLLSVETLPARPASLRHLEILMQAL